MEKVSLNRKLAAMTKAHDPSVASRRVFQENGFRAVFKMPSQPDTLERGSATPDDVTDIDVLLERLQ